MIESFSLLYRLEKEYTVIRKEEQEEQVEIRVCILYRLRYLPHIDIFRLIIETTK